jgi:hypothetical protein
MLIADEPIVRKKKVPKENFKPHHRIDESVIAISRAAFSAGIGVCVPYDNKFAPLVIQLAAEYIAPRYAEGGELAQAEEKELKINFAVRLIDLQLKNENDGEAKADPVKKLLENMGVVSKKAFSLNEIMGFSRPKAIFLIGSGKKIKRMFYEKGDVLRNVPIFSFRSCGDFSYPSDQKVHFVDEEIITELIELRKGLRPIKIHDDKLLHREEDLDKENRFLYTPYSLIAQRMLRQLGINKEDPYL